LRPPTPTAGAPSKPPPDNSKVFAKRTDRWRVSLGAEATGMTLVGPDVRFGPEPFIEVSRDSPRVLSPAIRISGVRIGSGDLGSPSGGSASLTLTAGRLEGCPLRWRPVPTLGLLPCVGTRVGVLEGNGSQIVNARGDTRVWVSVELLARLQWELLDWLLLELQVGGMAALFQYQFYFAPDARIYDMPVLGGFAGAGVGVRFP
jgi:hypothetical protein